MGGLDSAFPNQSTSCNNAGYMYCLGVLFSLHPCDHYLPMGRFGNSKELNGWNPFRKEIGRDDAPQSTIHLSIRSSDVGAPSNAGE